MRRLNEVLDTEPAMTFPDIADEDLEGSIRFGSCDLTYPNR